MHIDVCVGMMRYNCLFLGVFNFRIGLCLIHGVLHDRGQHGRDVLPCLVHGRMLYEVRWTTVDASVCREAEPFLVCD